MVATILGCGTSTGVPVITCTCRVCRSAEPRNHRLRASLWVQARDKSIVIDTGPDFRHQALRAGIRRVDAVLYTHPHADHCHGIDELRTYNFAQRAPIPIYCHEWTARELPVKFSYIFKSGQAAEGAIPNLELNAFDAQTEALDIQGVRVIPLPLLHGSRETVGYRIDSVAYVVDCSYIPPISMERLKGLSTLVLDCVQLGPHRTHLNLEAALAVVEQLKPRQTFLTHLGHEFDYEEWMGNPQSLGRKLPEGVSLAHDGLAFPLS